MFDLVQNVPLQMWFQHILPNTLRWMRLMYENCSLRRILFSTFKQYSHYTKASLQKLLMEIFKSESCKSYFRNKEQKWICLVVSQSNVLFGIAHPFFFFFLRVWSGAQVKFFDRVEIHCPELFRVEICS